MRRLTLNLVRLLLLLGCVPTVLAQLPGQVQMTGEVSAGTASQVRIQLVNCGAYQPRATYDGAFVSTQIKISYILTILNGAFSQYVWPNDLISCGGTTGNTRYTVTYIQNGVPVGQPETFSVPSTINPFDTTEQTPVSSLPPASMAGTDFHFRSLITDSSVTGNQGSFNSLNVKSLLINGFPIAQQDGAVPITGGIMSGPLQLPYDPTLALQAATKQYVDGTNVFIWERYLSNLDGHGGTDYGYACTNFINQIQPQSLTHPVELKSVAFGAREIYSRCTTIFGPVTLSAPGGWFQLNSSLNSTPITISGATIQYSATPPYTVTVPTASITGGALAVGMKIHIKTGSTYDNNITALATSGSNTIITLALQPKLKFYAIPTGGSNVLCGLSSAKGLQQNANQSISGVDIPVGAMVGSINYAYTSGCGQSLTIVDNTGAALAATGTTFGFSGNPSPVAINVTGSWTSDIEAVSSPPIFDWQWYQGAPVQLPFHQMVGAGVHDMWVIDNSNGGLGRTIHTDVFRVSGHNKFIARNIHVDNVAGTAWTYGGINLPCSTYVACPSGWATSTAGHQAPAEDDITDAGFYNDGDWDTGQSALAIMTPDEGYISGADEINQLTCKSCHIVFSQGPTLHVGTYNQAHIVGPRIISFLGDTQLEEGNYSVNGANLNTYAPVFVCTLCHDVHLVLGEINGAGYGLPVADIDKGVNVSMDHVTFRNRGNETQYNVNLTPGSATVTFASTQSNTSLTAFPNNGQEDGVAANLTDNTGTYTYYLAPQNAVSANGLTMTLASPYTGTATTGTITIGLGSYMVAIDTSLTTTMMISNDYYASLADTQTALGLSDARDAFIVGGGPSAITNDYLGWFNYQYPGGASWFYGPVNAMRAFAESSTTPTPYRGDSPNIAAGGSVCNSTVAGTMTSIANNYFQDCLSYAGSGSSSNAVQRRFGTGVVTQRTDGSMALSTYINLGAISGNGTATYTLGATAQVGTGATTPTTDSGHIADSISGEFSLTTGTGTLSQGTIVTITLPYTRSNAANCSITQASSAPLTNFSWTTSTTQISIMGTATASTSYKFIYNCGGR